MKIGRLKVLLKILEQFKKIFKWTHLSSKIPLHSQDTQRKLTAFLHNGCLNAPTKHKFILVRTCSGSKQVRMMSNTSHVCFMIRSRQMEGQYQGEKKFLQFQLDSFFSV